MATLWYSHFDSTPEDTRLLLAEDWAKYIRNFLGDGIKNGGTNLQVTADGTGMHTLINLGYANIQGYFFKIEEDVNGNKYQLDHPSANNANARIDRIVLRLDRTISARNILPVVLIGEPGTERPPALTRTSNIWEISLAQVRVPAGATIIYPANITDERFNPDVCGIINSLISADTEEFSDRMLETYENFKERLAEDYGIYLNELIEKNDQNIIDNRNQFALAMQELGDWLGSIKSDITKLQTFDFDNMPALPGTTRTTEFRDDDSIYTSIVNSYTNMIVAFRETVIFEDDSSVSRTVLYDIDGTTKLVDVTVKTYISEDDTITNQVIDTAYLL